MARLKAICRRRSLPRSDRDDVVSVGLVAFVEACADFDGRGRLMDFAILRASHRMTDYIRTCIGRPGRPMPRHPLSLDTLGAQAGTNAAGVTPAADSNPGILAQTREERARVTEAVLEAATPRQRQYLQLIAGGLNQTEVSTHFGVAHSAVSAAMANLRARVKRAGIRANGEKI